MTDYEYSESLYQAIDDKDISKLRTLLSKKGNVNSLRKPDNPVFALLGFENIYPLEKACKTSYTMANMLLEAGADPKLVDPYLSCTTLIYALSAPYKERFVLAKKLIDMGVDVNRVDNNGRTALNKSVCIFDSDDEATKKAGLGLMQLLLKKCNVQEVIKKSNNNPLVCAAIFDNEDATRYLLDNKVLNVDSLAEGYSALMRAVINDSESVCKVLLDHGANTKLVSPTGKTVYDYARNSNSQRIRSLLGVR